MKSKKKVVIPSFNRDAIPGNRIATRNPHGSWLMAAVKSAIRNPQSAIALIRNLLTPHSSLLTFFLLLLLLQGCASPHQTWYKAGGTQREFDLDARECEVIAEQQALLKSENGRRYDPLTYVDLYQRCITAKGWSSVPPQAAQGHPGQEPLPAPALGQHIDNRLAAFGLEFTLPADARLLSEKKQTVGPTNLDSFMFRAGGNFVNFILQESEEATFNPIDYPVSPPYQLYTAASADSLRWTAFWGVVNGEWVKGIGAFFTVSKKQRVIVVITADMAAPEETPPEDLHLARNQYQEMEAFIHQWQPWLEKQAPRESVVKRGLKSAFDMLKTF